MTAPNRTKMQAFQLEAFSIMKAAEQDLAGTVPWPDYFSTRTAEHILLVRSLFERQPAQTGSCMEIGCGPGYTLLLWALVADSVIGVDDEKAVSTARKVVQLRPDLASKITLVPGAADKLPGKLGPVDLLFSQYVLEHLQDPSATLARLKCMIKPGGCFVHVVNNLVDRLDWQSVYRGSVSWLGRMRRSLRYAGFVRTFLNPDEFTPPHEPVMGSCSAEQRTYRLERWTRLCMEAGYEITDHFQTRDTNWVIVTRPMP